MSWDLFLRAFGAVYLISIIVFMIVTYLGYLNDGFTRVLLILLWPAYFALQIILNVAWLIADICIFFLENFWAEDFSDFDDDDSDPGAPA
jgi:hypothetical protein